MGRTILTLDTSGSKLIIGRSIFQSNDFGNAHVSSEVSFLEELEEYQCVASRKKGWIGNLHSYWVANIQGYRDTISYNHKISQAISQDIHLSIHCSIYCYYESPIWPPTIDMSGMSVQTHPKTHGSKIIPNFSRVDFMWDSTTFGDQQDTVRRKVHGDPPNPRVLHLGIKLSNELNGQWTSAREPVM